MLVINANLGKVETLTKKQFIEDWGYFADTKLYEDVWEYAADSGYYAFKTKNEAVLWCLENARYYADLDPQRTQNIIDALSYIIAKDFGFEVLTAKNRY